jgi:hypothetical protein
VSREVAEQACGGLEDERVHLDRAHVRGSVQQREQDVAPASRADDQDARLLLAPIDGGGELRAQRRDLLEVAVEGDHPRADAVVDHDLPLAVGEGLLGADADHREGVPTDVFRRHDERGLAQAQLLEEPGRREQGGQQRGDGERRREHARAAGGEGQRRERRGGACHEHGLRPAEQRERRNHRHGAERRADEVHRIEAVRLARAMEQQPASRSRGSRPT